MPYQISCPDLRRCIGTSRGFRLVRLRRQSQLLLLVGLGRVRLLRGRTLRRLGRQGLRLLLLLLLELLLLLLHLLLLQHLLLLLLLLQQELLLLLGNLLLLRRLLDLYRCCRRRLLLSVPHPRAVVALPIPGLLLHDLLLLHRLQNHLIHVRYSLHWYGRHIPR